MSPTCPAMVSSVHASISEHRHSTLSSWLKAFAFATIIRRSEKSAPNPPPPPPPSPLLLLLLLPPPPPVVALAYLPVRS